MPGGRASANEIFEAMNGVLVSVFEWATQCVLESYQESVLEAICSREHGKEKAAWYAHQDKRRPGRCCRGQRFQRAGSWNEDWRLRGERG